MHSLRNKYQKKMLFQPYLLFEHTLHPPCLLTQSHRESFNERDIFEPVDFITIDYEHNEFRCLFTKLEQYRDDKIRFVTKMQVSQVSSSVQKNRIMIIKEPIFSSDDIITFLLIFQWFPNSNKTSRPRKNSLPSQKDITFKSKFYKHQAIASEDLLSSVYLISQKIYLQQKYIDLFVSIISENIEVSHKHINCITVLQNRSKKNNLGALESTAASKFNRYMFQNNKVDHVNVDHFTIRSKQSTGHQLMMESLRSRNVNHLKVPRSVRGSQYSHRTSGQTLSLHDEKQKKSYSFNLKKLTKYFSAIEYVYSDSEIDLQLITFQLRDNQNIINIAFTLSVLTDLFKNWHKYNNFNDLYTLNKDKLLKQIYKQSLENYREMLRIEFQSLELISVHDIYLIIRQFNEKTINQFLAITKEFINEPNYQEYIQTLDAQLNLLQSQMLHNYALTKFQFGSRMIKGLYKSKKWKKGLENYSIMKIIGIQEISQLDIGYRMYKQLIESNLQKGFEQLSSNRKYLKNQFSTYTGNNDQDMLNNIQNRIQICEQKKKMVMSSIELSVKEADTLQEMMRHMHKNSPPNHLIIQD